MNRRTIELIFTEDFDERGEWEAEQRGLLDNVKVRLEGATIYNLCFFTPQRLGIEFALLEKAGEPWLAYPGLILIPAVTRSAMQKAVSALAETDFFDHLVADVQ
jgi:hypothetical protein